MRLNNQLKPNVSLLIWNVTLIILYILYECWVLWSPTRPFIIRVQLPFYALLIAYYVFASYVYLPYVFERFHNSFVRIFSMLLLLVVYTVGYAVLNTILISFIVKKWVFDISWMDLKLSSNRCLGVLGISVSVWMARYIIMNVKKIAEYKIQKLEAEKRKIELENAFLKSQLGPHLMFNSLSSIYNKVVKQTPDAPETIELLTDLLDYSLANNNEADTVKLKVDLEKMKKSIKLNKLVSIESCHLNYSEELEDENIRIAPLVMQGFVDNIFKHGDLSDPSSTAVIKIKLKEKKLHS